MFSFYQLYGLCQKSHPITNGLQILTYIKQKLNEKLLVEFTNAIVYPEIKKYRNELTALIAMPVYRKLHRIIKHCEVKYRIPPQL